MSRDDALQPTGWRSTERERHRKLAEGTHVPHGAFRWLVDYDGERILQQRCSTSAGAEFWKDVPEVRHHDAY